MVDFIVRAVDDILKSHFNLPQGLADTSKTQVTIEAITPASKGSLVKQTKQVHRVQILDPATGTGTFLAKTVEHIYQNNFASMQGAWPGYVKEHLIPRLNGFELLMTSYAMAHLKLDMLLTETGYQADDASERFHIYLTNSLEEHHPDTGTLFASWLSTEANEANHIKRDAPVMVVMGNPPYSVSSSNKSAWIQKLLVDYKKDLNERNIQPLSDDYIKFIRFGQHFIDKKGEGILAYISNNSFIDGIIHRQMRKSLLESFDEIYILDCHGNAKKQETAPDGSKDENVFDIMQGVSINLFIKTGKKASVDEAEVKAMAKVFHHSLYGKREDKYKFLNDSNLKSLPWEKINYKAPEYLFIQKDAVVEKIYKQGFSVNELFPISSGGIKTHRDHFVIDIDQKALSQRIQRFYDLSISDNDIKHEVELKDNRDWNLGNSRRNGVFDASSIKTITYRPFDNQVIYYDANLIDFGRQNVMRHILAGENYGLCAMRQFTHENFSFASITKNLIDNRVFYSNKGEVNLFPLYIYPKIADLLAETTRTPNLNPAIVQQIATGLGLNFTPEKTTEANTLAPIDLLDYIYAVLHSPTYRETYKEFLKIDFPRVLYPTDATQFWQLVALGGELRQTHLLEVPVPIGSHGSSIHYPISGDNVVLKPFYENGSVYINPSQYFSGVPALAWSFYIGGYQPAQKWLKDRKGRMLSFEDILHYQKIIIALVETDRLMQAVDKTLTF